MAHFSHRPVYGASLPFPVSIGIFPVRATLIRSEMLYVINIRSKYRNSTLFCSALMEKHTAESFNLLRSIVFFRLLKLGISRFHENFTFDLSNLSQILAKIKSAPSIASTRRRLIAVFPLGYTTLIFQTCGGSKHPPSSIDDCD